MPSHLSKFPANDCWLRTPPPTTPLFPACGRKKKHFFPKNKTGTVWENIYQHSVRVRPTHAFPHHPPAERKRCEYLGKGREFIEFWGSVAFFHRREGDSLSAPLSSIFFERQQQLSRKIGFFSKKHTRPLRFHPWNIVSALFRLFDGKLVLTSVRNKSCSKEHVSISQMERSHKSNCVLTTMRSGRKCPHFGVLLYFFFKPSLFYLKPRCVSAVGDKYWA